MVPASSGRDVIVMGASAGGLGPLKTIIAALPADLPACVCVVMHTTQSAPGLLATILDRLGPLPAQIAVDQAPLEWGRIYVAPPDHHLLIKPGRLAVVYGPHENSSRPAIDPLFRSAARAYGPRVIGVVLSGVLRDGTYGALMIKARGGLVVAQTPADAASPSMPQSVCDHVNVDQVVDAGGIGPLLSLLSRQAIGSPQPESAATLSAQNDGSLDGELEVLPTVATLPCGHQGPSICPQCGGPLWQMTPGSLVHFRCHVGHAFTGDVLLDEQSEALESALWTAIRLLDEHALLLRRLAQLGPAAAKSPMTRKNLQQAFETEQRASLLRKILLSEH